MRMLLFLLALAFTASSQAAVLYVRSTDGSDGDSGATWALAKATIAGAFTAAAAGDTIYVSQVHAETQATAMTLTSPGTAASPVTILCVNDGAEPPTALATTATVTTTSGSDMNFNGFAYYYGIAFSCGTTSSGCALSLVSASPWWHKFEKCSLRLATTSTASTTRIFAGAASITSDDEGLELIDTTIGFGATAQTFVSRCPVLWLDTTSALIGTLPTTLFYQLTGNCGPVLCRGVDFSALTTGKSLILANAAAFSDWTFIDCKLGNGLAITNGASFAGQGGPTVTLINCDSNDTKVAYYRQNYRGIITTETTIVRTSGASDGVTPISRKMVSGANTKFYAPLESDPIVIYNTSTNSTTLKIACLSDAVTYTDAELWVRVEEQGTSGSTKATTIRDRSADILATPANQTTDATSTWTTTGTTTPVKQELSVTFTPAGRGIIRAYVNLAKASSTNWFCPKAIITQ